MTKRDFFILLIRVFGLYYIISIVFSAIPNNIAFVIYNIEIIGIIWLILAISISIGLFYILLYKSDKISDLLKLKNGFDEDRIEFGNLKSIDVIKFAILIIGGFLFIENIPSFLSNTLFAFKSSMPKGFDQSYNQGLMKYNNIEDYIRWGSSASNLIIGYLLISNFKKLSKYLDEKIAE